MTNNLQIPFSRIAAAIEDLPFPEVDLVVGIGSGGVVPAALVAYRLGCDLQVLHLNYRDDQNRPRYDDPVTLAPFALPEGVRRVLLVDDVSVSGKTLRAAGRLLEGVQVVTFVLKGRADYVAFPDVSTCVDWPWKRPLPA